MIEIRPAGAADAEAAARCHAACWREGYAGLLSEEELARTSGDLPRRIRIWESMIAAEPGPLLALDGPEVVGIAKAGTGRDDDIGLDLELVGFTDCDGSDREIAETGRNCHGRGRTGPAAHARA